MENGTTDEEDMLLSGDTEIESPSAPSEESCNSPAPHSPSPASPQSPSPTCSTDNTRQKETHSQQTDSKKNKRTTQKTLLAQLVSTNQQLCADLKESRRQELELRRMELEIMRESATTEKRLTDALVKYLEK